MRKVTNCLLCAKKFTVKSYLHKYCSPKCSWKITSSERAKRYYKRHKKECLARGCKWAKNNAEKIRQSQHKHYLKKRDFYLEKSRQRYKEKSKNPIFKKRLYERRKEYHLRNKGKDKARCATFYAIKTGKLRRPKICPLCKRIGMVEAHHKDYSKPLRVSWMCKSCHSLSHRFLF